MKLMEKSFLTQEELLYTHLPYTAQNQQFSQSLEHPGVGYPISGPCRQREEGRIPNIYMIICSLWYRCGSTGKWGHHGLLWWETIRNNSLFSLGAARPLLVYEIWSRELLWACTKCLFSHCQSLTNKDICHLEDILNSEPAPKIPTVGQEGKWVLGHARPCLAWRGTDPAMDFGPHPQPATKTKVTLILQTSISYAFQFHWILLGSYL